MKQQKLLFVWMAVFLLTGLASCSEEDKSVFGDDFEIPELTDANTIQFTVDASSDWKVLELHTGGGRMAVEWGDGRLQKVESTAIGTTTYRYGNAKSNHVRIWAEELDFCRVEGTLLSISNLRIGNLPAMKDLSLDAIKGTKSIDLSVSCPNLETLSLVYWQDLENIELSGCSKLTSVTLYNMPKLTSLELGNLPVLRDFRYSSEGLTSLSLKGLPALSGVSCWNCDDLSSLEVDDNNKISSLELINCAVSSADFLSKMPSLAELNCNKNKLVRLDLSKNSSIRNLDCSNNLLESIILPTDNSLISLACHANHLTASALNSVFSVLNEYHGPLHGMYKISFYDNPDGENECAKDIFQKKGWKEVSKDTYGKKK